MYRTNSLKDEYRTNVINCIEFDECEHCGVKEPQRCINIKYYHKYKKVLCDRCVDNKDGATVWSDKFAKERGLPEYPRSNHG